MFKYETPIDDQMDVAAFLSKKLDFPDEKFLKEKLVRFNLSQGQNLSVNGFSHDIGLVVVTKGSLEIDFTPDKGQTEKYVVKNSWYGFVSLLSSPTGTPFPQSKAKEGNAEGYILTRTAFKEMCLKTKGPLKKATMRILKQLSPLIYKAYFTFNWKVVPSGTKLLKQGQKVNFVLAVINGKLKIEGQQNNDDFLYGVFDCVLNRPQRHNVIASRGSELCQIPCETIVAFKNRYPQMQNRLVKVLGEQLLGKF